MSRLRRLRFTAPVLVLILLAIPVLAEVISLAAQEKGFTRHDLAYYLDENLINFVRPGLQLKITAATIKDSKISVRFTLTDPKGLPLDREGVVTPGAVSTSFIAAYIPKGDKLYTAYTTRTVTSPITKQTAVQAGTDSGGSYTKNADGDYTYTFKTTVPANFDPTATHTIGIYSSRNLTEFELGTQYADAVFNFVPDGSQVKTVRDVASTTTCNHCHDPLSAHGGPRRSVGLCILCHTPQTTDPDTGNTVDMTVMVHKIHMGEHLPSVQAGTPYRIIGHNQSVADYSTVAFPDQVQRCEACHTGASQSNIYLAAPSRRACGSCHDDVNFATGDKHLDLPQVSDNMCANCHIPQGELEYDASIKGAHTIGSFSAQMPCTTFSVVKVENTAPGQKPTVTFTAKDKAGNVLDAAAMDLLNVVLAGPATDYAWYKSEDVRKTATRAGNAYVCTLTNAIPSDAKGTYLIAVEGYKNVKLNPGTKKELTARDVGNNAFLYFDTGAGTPQKRRAVVSEAKCNSCHGTLMIHGTIRRTVEYCTTCHNPTMTDAGRRPADKLPADSINFKTMIHKIHTGEELTTTFTLYGRGGAVAFNEVRYPADRRNCEKCHNAGTYELPLGEELIASVAPRDYINPLPPVSGACLSCHTTKPAAAHASIMTSPTLGESCDACHGKNSEKSVVRAHAR